MTVSEMITLLEEYKEKRGENTEIIVRITNPSTMDFDFMDPIFEETDEEILICAD